MIRIPKKLNKYVEFEEGKIIAVDLPPELEEEFEKFKKTYERLKKEVGYGEY